MSELKELQTKVKELKSNLSSLQEAKSSHTSKEVSKAAWTPRHMKVLKGHFGKVYAMHWSGPSEERVVSASQDGKLIIWNALNTNKVQAIPLRSAWVMTCTYEQENNKFVACGGLDNTCSVYRVSTDIGHTSKPEAELSEHDGYLSCCKFMGENKMLTSSGDTTCIYWDVSTTTPISTFVGHDQDTMSVDPSPTDSNMFVSGSVDSTCKLWDIRHNKSVMTFEGHDSDVNGVTFFPDGKSFASCSDDSSMRMFDLRALQSTNFFWNQSCVTSITACSFSKSGRLIFGGYETPDILVWDTCQFTDSESGEGAVEVCQFSKSKLKGMPTNKVSDIGVHSNGNALCAASWDSHLRVFA